jgi:glutaredoxin-related protein
MSEKPRSVRVTFPSFFFDGDFIGGSDPSTLPATLNRG